MINSTFAESRSLRQSVHDCLSPHIQAVERLFDLELRSQQPCVRALVGHISRFRGKMLRPMLVLLCGKAAGKISDEHVVVAAVVEMVHMATLVHDDVLDESDLRRNGATINHLRGNEAAVLLGDYLISHSYHLCSSLDSQYASRLIGQTTNQACEGELLQVHNRNNLDLDEETYLQIIRLKTAVLCAACCELGAALAGADEITCRRMHEFGLCLGIAFQIQDDLLDIVGVESKVGKTLGLDILKGKLTLPVIHFLGTAPAEHRQLLRSLLSGDDADKVERIRNLILPSRSIVYARQRAVERIEKASQCLADLPRGEARDLLQAMADFVVERNV